MGALSGSGKRAAPIPAVMWFYVVAATVAFVAMSVLAHLNAWFFFDPPATHTLQHLRGPVLDGLMRAISWPGYPPQWLLVFAIVVAGLVRAGWRIEAVIMGAAEVGIGVTGFLLKPLVDRHRPPASLVWIGDHVPGGDPYTFTAGHVHTAVVMFGWLVFLLAIRTNRDSLYRRVLIPASIALLVLTGISRVYLGDHWLSDVLGGYLLGSIWLALEIIYYRRLAVPTGQLMSRVGESIRGRMGGRGAARHTS